MTGPRLLRTISLGLGLALLVSCSSTTRRERAPEKHHYRPVHGESVLLRDGRRAIVPRRAPREVHMAVKAGNRLQSKPYRYGGGHARVEDRGYDCSGTVSYALIHAGLLDSPLPSKAFRKWGQPGAGRWITVFAKHDHSFIVIGGLRLDTGWAGSEDGRGPRWKTRTRPTSGYVMRHPRGL